MFYLKNDMSSFQIKPEQDLENYYKAKISQAKQEFLALQEKKQQIEEELEAAGKIMDDPVKAMTYAFEAQHLDMEMELGAEVRWAWDKNVM